jgi:ribonuclease T1
MAWLCKRIARRFPLFAILAVLIAGAALAQPATVHASGRNGGNSATSYVALADLPVQARATLRLIERGGPFPYARDGVVFHNYERRLPRHPRGYYHEYTVKTPGVHSRGARRIIAGANGEYYYTNDHYRSFRRIRQ